MIQRLRNRIARSEAEGGFTLIELLVVIIIIGILLAVAVPSYLGFRDRANDKAAQANLRALQPAMEAFYADNGNYDLGATRAARQTSLRTIDSTITLVDTGSSDGIDVISAAGADYCITSKKGNKQYYKDGPGGTISTTVCT
jgi:type IV pilus assembly protein PilA